MWNIPILNIKKYENVEDLLRKVFILLCNSFDKFTPDIRNFLIFFHHGKVEK